IPSLALSALALSALLLGGCLFDHGSAETATGPVHADSLCAPSEPGCPLCSTPDYGRCRDRWYTTGLRCLSDEQCGGTSQACQQGLCVFNDADQDGLDDDFEREVAERNLPALRLAQNEHCPGPHGIVYRVRRHPQAPQRLAITYVVLYQQDCGDLNGHIGDD